LDDQKGALVLKQPVTIAASYSILYLPRPLIAISRKGDMGKGNRRMLDDDEDITTNKVNLYRAIILPMR